MTKEPLQPGWKSGDTVAEGDILAEIETDKATMEFESFNAGTLLYGIEEGILLCW
jgi:pyruvate dehydrogenase E2 component (dihydrolipoamide acetyltransferase)